MLDLPAGMTLEDVAPDGRVLVSLDAERVAMATTTRDGKPTQDLISPGTIGTLLKIFRAMASRSCSRIPVKPQGPLFHSPSAKSTVHRRCNWAKAAPAIFLQTANGRFPILPGSPGRVTLVPLGPGQPRTIPITGLEHIDNGVAHFLGDGNRITFNGNEPGHRIRTYLVNLAGGKPVPITPEGITGGLISPDGLSHSPCQRSGRSRGLSYRWRCIPSHPQSPTGLYSSSVVRRQHVGLWLRFAARFR